MTILPFTSPEATLEAAGGKGEQWNAKSDFAGPQKERKPLTAWEKYAQVLLLSNELMFVD